MRKTNYVTVGDSIYAMNGKDPIRRYDLVATAPEHTHDWLFVTRDRWRDKYSREFILEFYKCECGAGTREYIPIESYDV